MRCDLHSHIQRSPLTARCEIRHQIRGVLVVRHQNVRTHVAIFPVGSTRVFVARVLETSWFVLL